jgi:hypothetical protein
MSVMMGYAEQLGLAPARFEPVQGTPAIQAQGGGPLPQRPRIRAACRQPARVQEEPFPIAVQAIRLLIYTGARRGEIEGLALGMDSAASPHAAGQQDRGENHLSQLRKHRP